MINPRTLITTIEKIPLSLAAGIASFLAIVVVRYVLESMLEGHHVLALHTSLRLGLIDFLHVLVSWVVLYWLLALGLAAGSARPLAQTNRIALIGFPLIWLPPLWDVLTGNSGFIVYQHDFSEFATSFVGLFNPAVAVSYVTPGVRIEIACAVALAVLYVWTMHGGRWAWLRALVTGLWVYGVVFLLGFLPALWFTLLGDTASNLLGRSILGVNSTSAAFYWYLPWMMVIGPIWLRLSSPSIWSALLASLRPSRVLIYLAITNLAFLSAAEIGLVGRDWLNPYDMAVVITMNLAVALAFVSMAILNDLHDLSIDRHTNPQRPLVRGIISSTDFVFIAWLCGGLALWFAVLIHPLAMYPLALTIALAYLYSALPFRLRRFVGIAHLILAAIAAGVYLYGSALVLGNLAIQQLNHEQLLALMLLFFIGTHFKDIKDVAGDRMAGVSTLATLLGPVRAYWMIGSIVILSVLTLIATGLIANTWSSWLALTVFTLGWGLVQNGERVFWVMLLALGILFGSEYLSVG